MKLASRIILICFLFTLFQATAQDNTDLKKSAFQFHASYIGDVVSNFHGGLKTGTTYLGLANIKADFDTENAKWWKGGEAFVNLANTHGGTPSASFVGDFQGVSNIEAGNLTFLYELWYKQRLGNFNFTIGLQDLNIDFATTESGSLFTNSSFGIQSSIADNISTPIFPLTALGANIQWNISDLFSLKAAIFDGTPDDFEKNPYNINWKLSKDQGYLAVTELQIDKSLIKNATASYKFGAYFHEHNDSIDIEQENGGFYFIADQSINSKFSVFSQIGFSPKAKNLHNHFYSLGFSYKNWSKKRPKDQFGVAIAYAGIDGNNIGSETALEMTYLFNLNKYIYIRPDIQYIINPAGTQTKLKNALVGFIRVGVDF